VSTFTTRNGLVDDFVRVLAYHAASRTLWVGTDHGLSRLRDGRFESFGVADGLAHDVVKALHADPDGSVWVATQPVGRGGLHRIKEGRIERIVLPGLDAAPAIEALHRSADGAMWLATLDGLLRWSNGTLTRYTGSDGLSSNRVRALYEDQRGLWVATDGGVDLLPPGAAAFRSMVRDSFLTDLTSTVLTDREGNLWVGTRGRGVARFHRSLFRSYTVADGLPNAEVAAVLEDRHGTLWIGTAGGLATLDGKGVHTLPATAGERSEPILSLAEDGEGRLWKGTDTGVYRTVRPLAGAGSPPRFERLPGIPSTRIRVIHADRRGAVWIGADTEGLFRYDGTGVVGFGAKDGLSQGAVRGLAETRDGSLWIATKGGGLNRLKDGRFTTYTTKDGLPSDSVQTLYVDGADALWVATRQGLSRLKGGRFANVSTRDGLFASHVYGLGEDSYGNLWLTCGRGVFRVVKERMDAFADGRASSIDSIAYGRDDGLAGTMASVSTHPGVTRSKDGRMFFALSGAVATVDPSGLSINTVVPPVVIEEVNIDGSAFNVRTPVAAPPGRGDIMFRYAALTFIAPEKVHFRYRLEGFDRDWVDAGTRRVAYYTNVPPGRYQFHVVASNNDGVRNETGAALGVSVATRFYRTLWFYLCCALALLAATAAAHRWRLRQLRAHERELSARVEDAVAQIKTLKGLLPTCAACKSIRDDEGYWNKMEAYIGAHSEAEFSHGICPDCAEKLYPKHAHLAAGRRRPA
jgi:streptogramin lyase